MGGDRLGMSDLVEVEASREGGWQQAEGKAREEGGWGKCGEGGRGSVDRWMGAHAASPARASAVRREDASAALATPNKEADPPRIRRSCKPQRSGAGRPPPPHHHHPPSVADGATRAAL